MIEATPQSTGLECPNCGESEIVRYRPQEVGREVHQEEVDNPDEPDKPRQINTLRIEYRRDYFCPSCKHRWSETHGTEQQEET